MSDMVDANKVLYVSFYVLFSPCNFFFDKILMGLVDFLQLEIFVLNLRQIRICKVKILYLPASMIPVLIMDLLQSVVLHVLKKLKYL